MEVEVVGAVEVIGVVRVVRVVVGLAY